METRQRSTLPQRVYEDFVPQHELLREQDEDTLIVNDAGTFFCYRFRSINTSNSSIFLENKKLFCCSFFLHIGFSKDQLKFKIDRHGKLEMIGERPLTDTKWSRFHKEFQVPDRSTLDRIHAKFYNGLLEITLPKSSGMAAVQDEPTEAAKQQDVKKNQESDAQKVEEDKKDQFKEPKGTEKVAGKDGDEDDEEGTERIDAGKKAAVTPASYCGGKPKLVKLKLKIGKLNSETYQARQKNSSSQIAILRMHVCIRIRATTPLGLFSKAEELGAVCSADVAVVAFTSCGKAFSFGDDSIRRYLRLAREHDGNQDGREECGSVKATGMEDPVRRLRFLEELRRKAIARAEDLAQVRVEAAVASSSNGGTEAGEPFLVGATTSWGPSPLVETPVGDCSFPELLSMQPSARKSGSKWADPFGLIWAVPPPDRGGATAQSHSETEPRRCHRLTGAVLPPSLTRRLSPGGATA
ncbi:hypothetical protein C4D60_Mb01t30130 [Musa balbisiana]|uniref:SHSP domain-containing protein n=1 Tax=Musa balbisiana TaxID=52838 RepID=A0A4S8JRT2_MUSBA|nr:hypothetical protein C4D60_Mb01t30130 [Musa balbisiana]